MRYFDDFANFTAVNSHFLSPSGKCKHAPGVRNWRFRFWIVRLKSQTCSCSQSRMCRWQNTIFAFLGAQLDFLAKFYTPPYNRSKICILNNSSKVSKLSIFYNPLYFIGVLRNFYHQNFGPFFSLKKPKFAKNR